jgi:hypothetical protein
MANRGGLEPPTRRLGVVQIENKVSRKGSSPVLAWLLRASWWMVLSFRTTQL